MAGKLANAAGAFFGAKKKAGGNRASADRLKGLAGAAGGFVGGSKSGSGGLLGGLLAGAKGKLGAPIATGTGGDVIGPSSKPGRRLAKGRTDVKPGRRLGRGKGGRKANLPGIPDIPSIGGGTRGGRRKRG